MMPDNNKKPKISLEDLLAVKRAERPPEEFWDNFQREFHARQRAAAIEPKRWWFVLPRVFTGMARYQMPMGAAAVLAVTFLSFREYSEPGFEVAYTRAPIVAAVESAPIVEIPASELTFLPNASEQPEVFITNVPVDLSEEAPTTNPIAISPMVVWAGVSDQSVAEVSESPSARSIAANLAAVEAENGSMSGLLGVPELRLPTNSTAVDPLAEVTMPDVSRDRLFAYQPNTAKLDGSSANGDGPDIHSRMASRLNDDLLYESVRRVTGGGDHLTLKF